MKFYYAPAKDTGTGGSEGKADDAGKAGDDGKKTTGDDASKSKTDDGGDGGKKKEDSSASGGEGDPSPKPIVLTKPEGDLVTDADLEHYLAEAKELGYTQQQAEARLKRDVDGLKAEHTALETALKGDKDFGGAKYDASMAAFDKGIDALLKGSPETDKASVKAMFHRSGQKYNPVWHRVMARVLASMKEDDVDTSGKAGGEGVQDKALHELLYGADKK